MTFACITAALVLGGVAERVKFAGIVIFAILWPLLSYYPIAHMVWWWSGATSAVGQSMDAINAGAGMIWANGALDFAGGTVVHINAGMATSCGPSPAPGFCGSAGSASTPDPTLRPMAMPRWR
jgi:Amt family ammonium transporter